MLENNLEQSYSMYFQVRREGIDAVNHSGLLFLFLQVILQHIKTKCVRISIGMDRHPRGVPPSEANKMKNRKEPLGSAGKDGQIRGSSKNITTLTTVHCWLLSCSCTWFPNEREVYQYMYLPFLMTMHKNTTCWCSAGV